jgi:hypothetical protein
MAASLAGARTARALLDDGKHVSLEDASGDWNVNVPVSIGL